MQRFTKRSTPQTEKVPGKKQVKNRAGGFVFTASPWARLDRFLIIGTESGSYYANKSVLNTENVENILTCISEDHRRVVDRTVEVSDNNLALRNDPALFVLALCASQGSDEGKAYALTQLDKVARIGTHLFHFIEYLREHRGMGRAVHRTLKNWYTSKEIDKIAYQMVKYQSRDGWSHRDILRLVKPNVGKPGKSALSALFAWAVGKPLKKKGQANLPIIAQKFEEAKTASPKQVEKLITEFGLTREMIPSEHLSKVGTWRALLQKMPLGATIRNLGKMTQVGLLKPLSSEVTLVCNRLTDGDYIRRSRIHPMAVLIALYVYKSGASVKGSLRWKADSNVIDALNKCFELSFGNIVPANKRHLIGLDVSGSMDWDSIQGIPKLTAAVASAAMCKMLAKEPTMAVMAFADQLRPLDIGWKTEPVSSLMRKFQNVAFGRTDCSLPMTWAQKNEIEVDTFVVLTDNETWYGRKHPFQALKDYRKSSGINAKLAVCAFTASEFTIADPSDSGMMDFAGLDASLPRVVNSFSKGEI